MAVVEATAPLPSVPWLGVLIPAYNAAGTIHACLQSILSQAPDDAGIDILVLDDASTDDTRIRLDRLVATHPQALRVLSQPCNLGISAARNRLLAEAKAQYLWFVDADDVLLPGALADLRSILARHRPDLLLCDFRYLRGNQLTRPRCTCRVRGDLSSSSYPQLVAATLDAGELHVWSKIARREAWQQVEFPVGRHFEDIEATCQLLRHVQSWVHVHRPWIGYRQHPTSIMASLTAPRLAEWMRALDGMQSLLDDPLIANDRSAAWALTDFRLRNLASAFRRAGRLPVDERASAFNALSAARNRLFPQGTGSILRRWLSQGLWLRTLRTWRALGRGEKA